MRANPVENMSASQPLHKGLSKDGTADWVELGKDEGDRVTLEELLAERQTWIERIALATCGRPVDAGTRDKLFAVERRLDNAYPGWLKAIYTCDRQTRA